MSKVTTPELEEVFEDSTAVAEMPEPQPELSQAQQTAQHRALVAAHKERTKQMKQIVADKELEVAYWKAESDLVKYRFEKMDYYLRNVEIEPKYLAMVEEMNLKASQVDEGPNQLS